LYFKRLTRVIICSNIAIFGCFGLIESPARHSHKTPHIEEHHERTWRVDLFGETGEPLTIQWAGNLDALAAKLEQGGWHRAQPLTLVTALSFVAPGIDPASVAVVPRFSGGQLPELTLVRDLGPDKRLIMRLWSTDLNVDFTTPVWAGSVVTERISRLVRLLTTAETDGNLNAQRD
jgi:hypothetical protein